MNNCYERFYIQTQLSPGAGQRFRFFVSVWVQGVEFLRTHNVSVFSINASGGYDDLFPFDLKVNFSGHFHHF